ncbi:SLC13 family permease [Bradyrhizobium oropedii]|uniref:SLC13 family permease n=1 Tax=Bradyrhizobium oropedii TaxID=1571201 RepID=UPI00308462EE
MSSHVHVESSAHAPRSLEAILNAVGVPLAVIVAAAIWFAPTPADLSLQGHKALALFGGIFVLYLTEAIPLAIASLMVIPLAVLSGTANLRTALDGFSASPVYLIIGAFILATAMVKTRLAERITYIILAKFGSAPARITLGVTLINIVLAFLVPSSTARTAILLPECLSILTIFGVAARSPFAINLLLTLTMTNATIGAGVLTATVPNPVTVEFIAKASGHTITYAEWLLYGFPPALVMTFFTWWLIQRVFPPEFTTGHEQVEARISQNLASMGRMSSAEWRALIVFVLVTCLWATQGLTGLDTTVVCLMGACVLFLPRFGVMDWTDANKGVSWQVLLIAGGGVSLGDILLKTGAANWLANSIFHALGLAGASALVVIVVVMLIVQCMHVIFVGTTAMATGLLPIILAMAGTAGVNPVALALPAGMIIGGYPLLMFYNTLPSILVYGTGRLRVGDFPKVGIIACLVACLLYALCAATWWHWLGLV